MVTAASDVRTTSGEAAETLAIELLEELETVYYNLFELDSATLEFGGIVRTGHENKKSHEV